MFDGLREKKLAGVRLEDADLLLCQSHQPGLVHFLDQMGL